MKYSELAYRYASALFDLGVAESKPSVFLKALQSVHVSLSDTTAVAQFVASPLVRSQDKTQALLKAFKGSGLPEQVLNFVLLLAQKGRLSLLPEIIAAFQAKEDQANGVTRGTVRAAKELSSQQKEALTKSVSEITKKKVILQYTEDKSLIGGLVAQVGSLTFDDSLAAHLRRIKEDLTRSIK
jgi:F-type H+-transporting ATPase subunit delta